MIASAHDPTPEPAMRIVLAAALALAACAVNFTPVE